MLVFNQRCISRRESKPMQDDSMTQSKSLQDMLTTLRDDLCAERVAVSKLLALRHSQLLSLLGYDSHSVGNDSNGSDSLRRSPSIVALGELQSANKGGTTWTQDVSEGGYPTLPQTKETKGEQDFQQTVSSQLQAELSQCNSIFHDEAPRRSSTTSKPSLPSVICSRGTHSELDVMEMCSTSSKSRLKLKSKIRKIRTANSFERLKNSRSFAQRVARSESFEVFFAILILLNSFLMCVEAQYWGFDSGYTLGYKGMSEPASEVWEHASTVFKVLDIIFGVAFTLEVLIKIIGLGCDFIWSWWNWFDALIIASWLIHSLFESVLPVNPFTLRVARLARLVRILRLVKTLQVFDILHLMAASLKASVYVLLWSVVLLIGIMMSVSLVMVSLIDFYVQEKSNLEEHRHLAFSYFGTFSRAFLSTFELTLGNWVPITRFMHDNVSEWFGLAFMMYYCVVSFAVVMVIRGVFLHETFQAAGESDELMILRQGRYTKKLISKMQALFCEADETGDGYLNRREFINVMNDSRVKTWLEAMGLEVRDTEHVFEIMQAGDDRITAQEFASGFVRLRGAARSIDMVQVLRLNRAMMKQLQDVGDSIGHARRSLARG